MYIVRKKEIHLQIFICSLQLWCVLYFMSLLLLFQRFKNQKDQTSVTSSNFNWSMKYISSQKCSAVLLKQSFFLWSVPSLFFIYLWNKVFSNSRSKWFIVKLPKLLWCAVRRSSRLEKLWVREISHRSFFCVCPRCSTSFPKKKFSASILASKGQNLVAAYPLNVPKRMQPGSRSCHAWKLIPLICFRIRRSIGVEHPSK